MADLGWPPSYDDDGNPVDMLADPMPDEPRTELGYARRLIHVYGDRLRYVPAWRRWLIWDGTRWAHDSTGQAARWMKAIARRLTADALAIEDEDDARRRCPLPAAASPSHAVAGALTLASTEAEIAVSPDQLDADPFLLNCANGTLDLRTLELRAARSGRPAHQDHPRRLAPGRSQRGVGRVPGHGAARRGDARLPGPAHRARPWKAGSPSTSCRSTTAPAPTARPRSSRRCMFALGDYAGASRPGAADRPRPSTRTRPAPLTCSACGWRCSTNPTRAAAWPRRTVKRLTGGDRIKARRMREDFWWFDPPATRS